LGKGERAGETPSQALSEALAWSGWGAAASGPVAGGRQSAARRAVPFVYCLAIHFITRSTGSPIHGLAMSTQL